ncbi:hypothetical protein [Mesorhizobium sp. LNHC229A00]|uniref:hypothetical protein n=1 Tax=Mesorhizobium sp. LNHC229A00 TaxID=1287240 RepID=UPI0012EC3414|nr:hypothetical protein [Mesorhizobium sp. LNHC229A00]
MSNRLLDKDLTFQCAHCNATVSEGLLGQGRHDVQQQSLQSKGAVLSLARSLRCSHIRKIIPPMLTPVHAHRLIGSAACALRREKDPAAEADAGTGRSVEVIAAQLAASVAGLAVRRPIHISLPEAKWARVRCRLGSARGQP